MRVHRDTYIKQEPGESVNDRNDRAIRVATAWYLARLEAASEAHPGQVSTSVIAWHVCDLALHRLGQAPAFQRGTWTCDTTSPCNISMFALPRSSASNCKRVRAEPVCRVVQRVPDVVLLTNDADNRSRAQAEGLQAMTVQVGALQGNMPTCECRRL